jgi:hypothetical protein
MKWAMYLQTDAVLMNNPEKYLTLRDQSPTEKDLPENWPLRDRWTLFLYCLLGYIFL